MTWNDTILRNETKMTQCFQPQCSETMNLKLKKIKQCAIHYSKGMLPKYKNTKTIASVLKRRLKKEDIKKSSFKAYSWSAQRLKKQQKSALSTISSHPENVPPPDLQPAVPPVMLSPGPANCTNRASLSGRDLYS